MPLSILAAAPAAASRPVALHLATDGISARPRNIPVTTTARRYRGNRPGIATVGYYPAPGTSYAEVLVIADFAATGDEFHHRLITIGQSLGTHISLLPLPGDTEATECDCASDILLEGLLQRMRLPPGRCAIEASRPAVAISAQYGNQPESKLIVVGRSRADTQEGTFDRLLDLAYESGCDLIAVDDDPDCWEQG